MKIQDQNHSSRGRGRLALLVAGAAGTLALAACVPLKSPPPAAPETPPTTQPPTAAALTCTGPGAFTDVLSVGSTTDADTCVLQNNSGSPSGALSTSLTDQTGVAAAWDLVPTGSNDCAGISLAPGATCNIVVEFDSGGTVGSGQITLHVVGANGVTLDEQLSGTVTPDFDITVPASVTVADGANTQFAFGVENLGTASTGPLTIAPVVDDLEIGLLTMPGGTCVDLAPGGTCSNTYDWEGLDVGSTFVTFSVTPDTGVSTTVVVQLHVT